MDPSLCAPFHLHLRRICLALPFDDGTLVTGVPERYSVNVPSENPIGFPRTSLERPEESLEKSWGSPRGLSQRSLYTRGRLRGNPKEVSGTPICNSLILNDFPYFTLLPTYTNIN